jgi:hypothetical protein
MLTDVGKCFVAVSFDFGSGVAVGTLGHAADPPRWFAGAVEPLHVPDCYRVLDGRT